MLFFSITYNIYLKKGFFFLGGGGRFLIYSAFPSLSFHFSNVHPIFLNILFHGWGIPFIFWGEGVNAMGIVSQYLVDIPLQFFSLC